MDKVYIFGSLKFLRTGEGEWFLLDETGTLKVKPLTPRQVAILAWE